MVLTASFCHAELERIEQTANQLRDFTKRIDEVDLAVQTMNIKSVNLVFQLFGWMTNRMLTIKANYPMVDNAEHWKFISQAICSIFWELYKVQCRG